MADIFEQASDVVTRHTDMTIQHLRADAGLLEVHQTGYCLYCDEPLQDRRWCDADCRDDWEKTKDEGAR